MTSDAPPTKSTRNVEAFRTAQEAFNRQDVTGYWRAFAESSTFTDRATGQTLKGLDELREWLSGFFRAFPDATADEGRYLDAGDSVIHQSVVRGTNNAPLGPLPATDKKIALSYCEIWHFDPEGRVSSGEHYYDQLSLLTQLGHATGAKQCPAERAATREQPFHDRTEAKEDDHDEPSGLDRSTGGRLGRENMDTETPVSTCACR